MASESTEDTEKVKIISLFGSYPCIERTWATEANMFV